MTSKSVKIKQNSSEKIKDKQKEKKENELLESALSNLQPSRELVDFYRRKVSELSSDHEMLVRRLEQLNETCELQHKLTNDVREREEEINDLQRALSDMQVYLFKEREQVLRLYSENDRLKIRELDDRRKIAHLLQLSGLTQSEVTYFVKDPPTKALIEPTQAVKTITSDGFNTNFSYNKTGISNKVSSNTNNNNSKSTDAVSSVEYEAMKRELDSYKVQIQALQSQLEEQTRLYKEQTDALMEDRRIRQEETNTQRQRDQERIHELSEKLKRTQELLYENTKDFLAQRSQYREKERQLISEKDSMYRKLQLKETSLNNLSRDARGNFGLLTDNNAVSGKNQDSLQTIAWTEYAKQYNKDKEQQLLGEIDNLEYQLAEQQKMSDMYREQVIEMENQLGQLHEEEDATKHMYKTKSCKIQERLHLMNQRYKQLERRRNLEVQGFQTDIASLRKKLKTLEKQLYTIYDRMYNSI